VDDAKKPRRGRRDVSVFCRNFFSFPPRVSHDGMRVVMEMIAQRNPGVRLDTNIDKYVDERLLDELEKEGLFRMISGRR